MSEPPTVGVVLTEEECDAMKSVAYEMRNAIAMRLVAARHVDRTRREIAAIHAILTRHAEAQAGEWVAVRRADLAAVKRLIEDYEDEWRTGGLRSHSDRSGELSNRNADARASLTEAHATPENKE